MKRQLIYVIMGLLTIISGCRKSENLEGHKGHQSIKSTMAELIKLKSGMVVEKRGDKFIFLGDILLSEKQYKLLDETGTIFSDNSFDTSKKMPLNSILTSSKSGSHYFQTTSPRSVGLNPYQNMFWSMVRYTRNNNLSYTSRYYIDEAIAHWEATTNVRFYDATGEPTVDPTYGFAYPYVEFVGVPGNISSSQVGRIGGKQILEVGQISSIGTVIHEIGHAIGLSHEQNKPGRNNYINVDLDNVIDTFRHNFQEISSNYYAIGAGIDFSSIMMYHPKAFAINTSTEVITKKDGSSYLSQYQRDGLSSLDKAFANTFYLPFKPRFDTYRELDDIVYKSDNTVMTPQERLNLQASLNNGNPNPPSQEGTFVHSRVNDGLGKLYFLLDGQFRHIYSWDIYQAMFDIPRISYTDIGVASPSPLGAPLGKRRWPAGTTPIADAFFATSITSTGVMGPKLYLVEALYEAGVYYYYARWITTWDPTFLRYKFSSVNLKKILNLDTLLLNTATTNGSWILGPDIP